LNSGLIGGCSIGGPILLIFRLLSRLLMIILPYVDTQGLGLGMNEGVVGLVLLKLLLLLSPSLMYRLQGGV
jgi:hypothetical protein